MYKYRIQIKKVSGRLNESAIPSKNFVVKSKTKKTDKKVFLEVAKYCREKYGIEVESAEVIFEGFFGNVKKSFGKAGSAIKNAAKTLGSDLKNDVKTSFNGMRSKVSGMFNRGNKQKNQTSSQPQQQQPQPRPQQSQSQPQSQQSKKQERKIGQMVENKILLISGFYYLQRHIQYAQANGQRPNLPETCLIKTVKKVQGKEYPFSISCYALEDLWNGEQVSYYDSKLKVLLTTKSETNRMINSETNAEIQNQLQTFKQEIMNGGVVDAKRVKFESLKPTGTKISVPVFMGNEELGSIELFVSATDVENAIQMVDAGFAKLFKEVADEMRSRMRR